AHHVKHWAEGGETKASNLLLLCRFHHRLVHEGRWRVELWGRERRPVFTDPLGRRRVDPRPLRPGTTRRAGPDRRANPPNPPDASRAQRGAPDATDATDATGTTGTTVATVAADTTAALESPPSASSPSAPPDSAHVSEDPAAGLARGPVAAPSDDPATRPTGAPASAEALVRENRARGVDPDGRACGARWKRGRDIPWPVLARAREVLDGAL
ncbi:MAG: HNH endonuclease signature motif containing protein, partial [Gemmatimonadota bacterium]